MVTKHLYKSHPILGDLDGIISNLLVVALSSSVSSTDEGSVNFDRKCFGNFFDRFKKRDDDVALGKLFGDSGLFKY